MSIPKIALVFNESRQGVIPGDRITLSHRLNFIDIDHRIVGLIVRHRAAEQWVSDAQDKQLENSGFVAWIWRIALTFFRDNEQSLQRQILFAIIRRLENRHPVDIGLRYLENNLEQTVDLPHKAAELAELIKKGKHFHFSFDWVPVELGGGLRNY